MADSDKAKGEPREFELKLEFDPADLAAIEAHPLLAGIRLDRQTLVSVYYDTDTLALHEAGLCLRVRNTGKGYVQTVKSMNGMAELFDRPEWEREVSGPRPDLKLAAGTPLEPLLKDGMGERLRPLFQTSIERGVYHVASGGSDIEVAVDRGAIETAQRQAPVHEVELELMRGDPAELFRLARSLAATVPLRLAVKTKAERGYELAGNAAPGAEKAGRLDLDGKLSCQEAFRAVAQSCLRQIIVNEPGVCAGDAPSLHQMRIGLRRLRAAIVAFEKIAADAEQDRIRDELKWITNELGPARDLDVFEADILQPMSKTVATMRAWPRLVAPSPPPVPKPMGRRPNRSAPAGFATRCSMSPSGSRRDRGRATLTWACAARRRSPSMPPNCSPAGENGSARRV